MKTRISKISRLPKIIRDQINQKLEDNIPGNDLLTWLNDLPEVQKVLADHFGGRLITKQNLSDWRHTGFIDWAYQRQGRQQWWELVETAGQLTQKRTPENGKDASAYLGTILLVELAEALNEMHRIKNPDKRWKLMRMLSGALSRLRNDDSREKLLRLRHVKQSNQGQQIASSRAQSCSKNIFSQSCPPGSADHVLPASASTHSRVHGR
jgi:hypothetical protein